MATTVKIDVKDHQPLSALQDLCRLLLQAEGVNALLVPQHIPPKKLVMPALVADPEQLGQVDPLAPAFPMNAAKLVSKLTRKPMGGKVIAFLRPCEIRAYVELVKLKQGQDDNVILIGLDCLGALSNQDYFKYVGDDPLEATRRFYTRFAEKGEMTPELAAACKVCDHPVAQSADIQIGIFGQDPRQTMLLKALNQKGEALVQALGLEAIDDPPGRRKAIDALIAQRIEARERMFAETRAATADLEKLNSYFAKCINCYNCRVACPVCYCRECVFVTDVFEHDPFQYIKWANRKGVIKMPTDTVFYHLTRAAHMSTACVGCGQCSNACPNDIPVMELFRTVAQRTQQAFDYEAGRSIQEEPPLAVFQEKEYAEVVGL
jgi:formate dehydrogenase subunit beta